MKKLITILALVLAINLYAQTTAQWEDPYQKSDTPGYEELRRAFGYHSMNDLDSALKWYKMACEKGNLCAKFSIGLIEIDSTRNKDPQDGLRYILNAAQEGYAPAQVYVYTLLNQGKIMKQDKELAFSFLKSSADQGYPRAKSLLATVYILGDGVSRDVNQGLKILEECAESGDVGAQEQLGLWYYGQNKEKAFKWLNLAADNGAWKACNALAYMYAKGEFVEQNFNAARQLLVNGKAWAMYSNELTPDIEANFLDSEGEFYLIEEKDDEAKAIWNQIKTKFPEYVEKNKYEVGNVFVRTMYAKDQETTKSSLASNKTEKPVAPSIVSDIDERIPENAITGTPTFAVIIANENYMDVEGVPFASHDGETFKLYCEKTLGIPQSNIKFVKDATLNNMKRELNWLSQVMDVYQGEATIILYYAGHGIPNESNGSAYLLPVDGVGNDVSTGYSLDKLYADLSSKPAKSVFVLLDACFSGAKRDGGMLASARGVAIKARQNAPKGNMVVLSAAQGDETAYPYKEKGHGMFTYYLLKKLQETKGDVTFGELADYVTTEVKKQSIVINGKMQTPLTSPSGAATDWRNWKLK